MHNSVFSTCVLFCSQLAGPQLPGTVRPQPLCWLCSKHHARGLVLEEQESRSGGAGGRRVCGGIQADRLHAALCSLTRHHSGMCSQVPFSTLGSHLPRQASSACRVTGPPQPVGSSVRCPCVFLQRWDHSARSSGCGEASKLCCV